MKRYSTNFRKDRRVFTRTAENVHSMNFRFFNPQRGGIRL